GAVALNHAPAERLIVEGGAATGVEAVCLASGRRVRVRAAGVVEAGRAWVEAVARLEDPNAPSRLHLSKGVHVALPAARLPIRQIAILGTIAKRSIFAIPRGDVT